MRFHITTYDKNGEKVLYDTPDFNIAPGVTVLVGCNGAGKTTLLHRIKEALDADGAPVHFHEQMRAHDRLGARLAFGGSADDFVNVLAASWQSEGEGHMSDLGNLLPDMGRFIMANKTEHRERWLLLDGLESGLSIDAADELCGLIKTIEESVPDGVTLYLVISTNAYELAKGRNCIDVQTAKHMRFDTYEEYADFIRTSRHKKDGRRDISATEWETEHQGDTSRIIREGTQEEGQE